VPLPGIGTATDALKSVTINGFQTALSPGFVAGMEIMGKKQEEYAQRTLRESRDTNKNISPSKLNDAKKTITGIVQPGINIFNPMNLLSNAWYFLVDILPIKHSSNKILADNLEIFRNRHQTKDFQTRAMKVFRDHLTFLDIDMQRMGSKPPIFNIFPFNLFGKQNAERERTLAEKTKYLPELVQSLSEHLDFIKELAGQRPKVFVERDLDGLKRFFAEISDGGKYSKLKNYPPMQQVKAKVDEIIKNLEEAFNGRNPEIRGMSTS
jgi:hypothetical protein